ncbi:hypothetical protein BH11PSE4_BH11PSE4_20200 [soil metagenome]
MEPRHLIRAAIAVSVMAHLVLVTGFLLADARPFEPPAPDAVSVDIVPEQAAPPVKEVPQPAQPKPPDPFRLPELSLTEKQQSENSQQAASKPAAPAAQPPRPAAPQQKPAQQQPQPQQQPPPPETQQAAAQPPQTPPPASEPLQQQSVPPAPEPDITVKYGVMLGLPSGDGLGPTAYEKADIAPVDIEAFRRHLKSCSTLPGSVKPADKVRIVLRVSFAADGRLSGAPTLLEASASAKGPALMQAAISALQACQPYAMLPADKYKEWKVLDLAFTPQDFVGG